MNFERLRLESDVLRVEVIPELGGKISSLWLLGAEEELLQKPLRPYAARTHTMGFDEGEASGIDECIPTVSGSEVDGQALPDHGDFWRVAFQHRRDGDALVLEAEGFSLPLRLEKRLSLKGERLSLGYRLTNTGSGALPFLWSAHPGFAVEEGDRIVLPESVAETEVWYSGGGRLGNAGTKHSWPRTQAADGAEVDLSVAGGPADGVGDKLFAVAPQEGWLALERRRLGKRVEVHFDPKQAPYVGLWLAYGGWPDGQARRQHCVALEPCTAPADALDVAIKRGQARTLAMGAAWEWATEIRVVPI